MDPLGLGRLAAPGAADSREAPPGLKRGELAEPRGPVPEGHVFVVGEQRPVVLQPAVDAAVLLVADAVELFGLGDGQGFEKHGVRQGEDGGGRADSER